MKHFHPLEVGAVERATDDALRVLLAVPPALRADYAFRPGQFLTLRATIGGREERRSYSICNSVGDYARSGRLAVGIKQIEGGVFSGWAAASLRPGMTLDALPPEGRFCTRLDGAVHRVLFAAGSGITPLLSILASGLERDDGARYTLVYGSRDSAHILFGEDLQDLKDRYPTRLVLLHMLSRQAQELPLAQGRIDAAKLERLFATLIPPADIDEAFVCGPQGMIDGVCAALAAAGVPAERVHAERFVATGGSAARAPAATTATPAAAADAGGAQPPAGAVRLAIVLDGKRHELWLEREQSPLDAGLAAGLDLPYSCRAGVCCTCRARVLQGEVQMLRNFTLEPDEIAQGFILGCQARALGDRLELSFDER
jgi:ring-1,2-phenylacetyl-CoA epoxidase subunit PaaE